MHSDSLLELLSKSLDEDLSHQERDRLDQALAKNPDLRILKTELEQQRQRVKTPVPLPSDQVFYRLLNQVETKYSKSRSMRRSSYGYLATAALVLLAFAAGYFSRPTEKLPVLNTNSDLNMHLLQTREAYVGAIDRLEQMAAEHIRQMPPEVASQVEENLRVVNHAIMACENFAQAYPDQLIAFTSLAQAYQAKVELLQTLVYGANRQS